MLKKPAVVSNLFGQGMTIYKKLALQHSTADIKRIQFSISKP